MSKEPRPLPQPGEPGYIDPSKPRPVSPPPPPKRHLLQAKCCHEHRIEELEAALREIQKFVKDYQKAGIVLVDIRQKCREVLR